MKSFIGVPSMHFIHISYLFLLFSACNYGAESGDGPGEKPLTWITRLDNATDEELLEWFKDPNQPVNLMQDGRSLLHDVMKNKCISQDVKNALLDRADLDVEIKDIHGDTAFCYLLTVALCSEPNERMFYINMARKLRKCGAKLEVSDKFEKRKMLLLGEGLSLQQSYCQLCTMEDVTAFRRRLREEKSPLQDICLMVAGSAFWLQYTDCCDYFIHEPLAVLLATRKTTVDQKTKEKKIIQPTFSVQERYLQLQEFMPQSTIMQFLRLLALSDVSSKLIDIDVQKEEQRMCAELEKPESNKVTLRKQLQNLRNHKLRLWVLSVYHDFHKLHSENAV